jgi:DNA-binding HxlR family transcriptional regulator
MARATRAYDHFCSLARALEQVGDRWTLLIVRDLLAGPRRFTDLMERLGGITPKTLSERLRELTASGIVEADRVAGRREVWYRLTPAGQDLAPAVGALALWGLRHALRPPLPGERVHPEHLLQALRVVLAQTPPPPHPVTWRFEFAGDGSDMLAFDGKTWTLAISTGAEAPDVIVRATPEAWTKFLITPANERRAAEQGIERAGRAADIALFDQLLARFPDGATTP